MSMLNIFKAENLVIVKSWDVADPETKLFWTVFSSHNNHLLPITVSDQTSL